jgi:hypothetical protein
MKIKEFKYGEMEIIPFVMIMGFFPPNHIMLIKVNMGRFSDGALRWRSKLFYQHPAFHLNSKSLARKQSA